MEIWERKHAAPLLAKGWTRKEVDDGRRDNPDVDGGVERMVCNQYVLELRSINHPPEVKLPEEHWFDLDRRRN